MRQLARTQEEEEEEFDSEVVNLKELWGVKARIITNTNTTTSSRRYSASYIRTSREEDQARSFRSANIIISSTASSPGYTIREEIDPSTYSFTNALKALQAKTVSSSSSSPWDYYMSPEGLTLNSKWSEAERYICNPLSGEVPLECLSAKALTARSFRQPRRITLSSPLVYPSHHQPNQSHDDHARTSPKEEEIGGKTRDVGTQSSTTLVCIASNCPSPTASTPSIEERSIKRAEETESEEDSSVSAEKVKFAEEVVIMEGRSGEEEEGEEDKNRKEEGEKKKKARRGGCLLSWKSLWMKTRHHHRAKKQI